MHPYYKRLLAALLVVVMTVSLFAGCQAIPPELNNTPGSTEHTPGSTGTNATTGTTDSTKPTESTPGTEVTQPTDPTQSTTQPTDPTQPGTQPTQPSTQPTQPSTQPAGCAHDWDEWTVVKLATCGMDGEKVRGCPKCSATEFAPVPAFGHDWGEAKVETVSSGCGETTTQVRICKTCQQEEKKVTQITGSHTFGEWEYEEYTFQLTGSFGKVYTYTSHRKVRFCTKCNYKEAVNTENHVCQIGSAVHNVTEYKGDCQTLTTYRSTCTVCGWSTTFDRGEYGSHVIVVSETTHLTDYTAYTNELDVKNRTCTVCGLKEYFYTLGRGHERYRMKYSVAVNTGTAYANQDAEVYHDDRFIKHPTWQTVTRNEKFDTEGYLIQWDYIWHDAETGTRYSYTIRTDDIPAMFEAAGYDLSKYEGYNSVCYQFIIDGDKVRPYKITFT